MSNVRILNNFANSKAQCLGKRDKSFAGRIDVHAVEICSLINEREEYYTTSSCSGRCFLYQGQGVKNTSDFERCRISHELVTDAVRYFDLTTLGKDPTGGADPIPATAKEPNMGDSTSIWLRFEPFILHVSCRSLRAASLLMNAARPAFKNVGLTTWTKEKYLVAIWGDEGLDMPLCTPDGQALYDDHKDWLARMINERHERNLSKIDRFVQAIRDMPPLVDEEYHLQEESLNVPRSFDVIGDIAVIHNMPQGDEEELRLVGEAIMSKNKSVKICVARTSTLGGTERSPGTSGMTIIAGAQRSPLMTTHKEYGIKCMVDLQRTFFSPRMGPERLRICQQVARGEDVLVLFAGVAMEALQIAGRTEAKSVVAVEWNPVAVECARKSYRMLQHNKQVKCAGAAERLHIIEGNVLDVLPTLPPHSFDRVLAPRPKEGATDGDLGSGDCGALFLDALLPVLKNDVETFLHWYDFCADHEFPTCDRTRQTIEAACERNGCSMRVIHVANAGSVAKRQLRICMDVAVRKALSTEKEVTAE